MTGGEGVEELAVLRTLAEYCRRCDDGDFDRLVELFVADGEIAYAGRAARGRADLVAFFEASQGLASQRGKHLTTNAIIELEGDRAVVQSDYLFLRVVEGALTPAIAGRYDDELARGPDGWRFVRRMISRLEAPAG